MIEEATQIFREHDSFAAIEFVGGGADVVAAARAFGDLMRALYWKQKDLDGTVAIGRAGVQFGLSASAGNAALSAQLRGIAKGLAYDIASFTWPGWDEQGIVITATHVAIGLDAARANLRLGHELKKGDLPLSRGYWMLAGQRLASGDDQGARECYAAAARHGAAAGSEPDRLLGLGFEALVEVLQGGGGESRERLDAARRELRTLGDGEQFASQIDTAERVFSSGSWKAAARAAAAGHV